MTALAGLGSVALTAMQPRADVAGERDDRGYSFHLRLVMVRNNCGGGDVRTGQGLTKKGFRTGPLPFVPQEHIDDLPVLIHGTISGEFLLAAKTGSALQVMLLSDSCYSRLE